MQGQASILSPFSAALHQAVDNSHLSLAQIVSQLSERGFKISRTTLSQWQTGTSIPRRISSRILINELENVLGLPSQSLTSLLAGTDTNALSKPQTRFRSKNMRSNVGGMPSFNSVAKEQHFRSVEELIDPAHEVIRESIEEHLSVSADFHTITQDLSILVRIPDTKTPTMHTTAWWTKDDDLPDDDDIGVYNIKGAYPLSTQVNTFDDGLVKITCLGFPSYVAPHSLHHVSYKLRFHYDTPIIETTGRLISSKLRYYSCSLSFEGEAPQSLQWILSRTDSERSNVSHVIEARDMHPYNGDTQVTLEDVEHITCFFRWA